MNPPQDEFQRLLEPRIGRVHLRQRLGIENHHEHQIFGQGRNFFHIENWYSMHAWIRNSLRIVGLHGRGRRNARRIALKHHEIRLRYLPAAFDGFTLLQISDLHLDMSPEFPHLLSERVRGLDYDLCVLTGDFRYQTGGPFEETLEGAERLRANLGETVYGILGNHDSIRMVPALEAMGIRMLLNESVPLTRDGAGIHLAGVDDPHYFRTDSLDKARRDIPDDVISILLAHSPELYQQAAYCGFDVMLCGHTHGGQICLPGGTPVMLNAKCPRRIGRGSWSHAGMIGYTSCGAGSSVVDIRLNNEPEVTLHTLRRGGGPDGKAKMNGVC